MFQAVPIVEKVRERRKCKNGKVQLAHVSQIRVSYLHLQH